MATGYVEYMDAAKDWVALSELAERIERSLPTVSQFIRAHKELFDTKRMRLHDKGTPSLMVRSFFVRRKA